MYLQFQDSYFDREFRSDYWVESRMKHIWAASLELLKAVEEICNRHGLRYFADWGTLLGAVRHKGFIPWDDDIDIAMLREDYEIFLQVADRELPEGCRVYSVHTGEGYANKPYGLVLNSSQIRTDETYLGLWHGCPYVVGLDIWVRDYLSRNEEEERLREDLMRIVRRAAVFVRDGGGQIEEALAQVEEFCGVSLDRSGQVEHQLWLLHERLCKLFSADEADEIAPLSSYVWSGCGKMPKYVYERQDWMPFETTRIAVPADTDRCLKVLYGEHYMTPRAEENHTFYDEQEQMLRDAINRQRGGKAGGENGAAFFG